MAEIRDIWQRAHRMLRSARQLVNDELRPLNISSAEGNILLHLRVQGRDLGHEQLAGQLDISKPAVSRAINLLESKGLVTRQQDPKDRRVYWVRLTGRGREIGPAVEQAYNQLYTLAMEGITRQELEQFMRLFSHISENFSRAQVRDEGEDHAE